MMSEDKWAGWSWTEFWKGKLSNKLIAWLAYIVLQYIALLTKAVPEESVDKLIMWTGLVTLVFMLAGAIDTAVSAAKINIEMRAEKKL